MLIRSYGLFWYRDEIEWKPGAGKPRAFRLLGRRGATITTLDRADFREERGIYILYGDHGPYYVGLSNDRGLGTRLREHHQDRHAKHWDRFSWFGFYGPSRFEDQEGVLTAAGEGMKGTTKRIGANIPHLIRDVEALLIRAMGTPGNSQDMRFVEGERWNQVKLDEYDRYLRMATRR